MVCQNSIIIFNRINYWSKNTSRVYNSRVLAIEPSTWNVVCFETFPSCDVDTIYERKHFAESCHSPSAGFTRRRFITDCRRFCLNDRRRIISHYRHRYPCVYVAMSTKHGIMEIHLASNQTKYRERRCKQRIPLAIHNCLLDLHQYIKKVVTILTKKIQLYIYILRNGYYGQHVPRGYAAM